MIENQNNKNNENQDTNKENYIKQEQFEKLKQCQAVIFKETQIILSIKKIIHELITDDNLDKITEKFINLFRG